MTTLDVVAARLVRGSQQQESEMTVFRSTVLRWVAGNVLIALAVFAVAAAVLMHNGDTFGAAAASGVAIAEFSGFLAVAGSGLIGVLASFGMSKVAGKSLVYAGLLAVAAVYLTRALPVFAG